MRQFSPQQVLELLQQDEQKPVLLDVREPFEVELCVIEGSINIPLKQIPESLEELDRKQEYVLICHHGMRSHRAGLIMAAQGFDKLINLVGGIDAWACNVDSRMKRY
jgi:rhodanese-related sulfurtransferase